MRLSLRTALLAGALIASSGAALAEPVSLAQALAQGAEKSPRVAEGKAKADAAEARARGVRFIAVHPTPWATERSIAEHAATFGIAGAFDIVLDSRQEIAAAVGATVTPEGALLRLDGRGGFERLYLGRVNDLYAAVGRRRAAPTSNDLATAIRAAHEGRAVPSPAPHAIGCFIEYSPSSPPPSQR